MAGIFGNKNNDKVSGPVIVSGVDKTTGEVTELTHAAALAIPDMSTVTSIADVAGKNPNVVNLRDHPELNGMRLVIGRARVSNGLIDGRTTDFVIAEGWVFPPSQAQPTEDNHIILMTGSDNVYQRVVQAIAQNAFPVGGTLRFAGRARFLD